MTKRELAQHLGEWHGTLRCAVPLAELLKWRVDELRQKHEEMHAKP